MHFDELLIDHVGELGRFQKRLVFVMGTAMTVPIAWYTLGIVFLAAVPDHWCAVPALDSLGLPESEIKNLSIPITGYDSQGNPEYAQCSRYVRNFTDWDGNVQEAPTGNETEYCTDGWDYSTETYEATAVTAFDLVCDKDFLLATSSSLYMAGFLFGVISIGIISDNVGRTPTMLVAMIFLQIASITLSFVQSFPGFCVLRFLQGFFGLGTYTCGFVLLLEMTGPNRRVFAVIVPKYIWTIGYLLFTVPAYFLRDWRTLNLVTSSISCLSFLAFFITTESPRWLYNTGRSESGDAVMKRIASVNRKTLPDPLIVTVKQEKKGNFTDLFRTPRMRLRSLVLFWIWMVCSLVYYGLSLSTNSLGGNNYVVFGISAAVEIPASIYAQVTLSYTSRRWSTGLTLILGGLCLLAILPIPPELYGLTIAFSMTGKCFLSAAFTFAYNYSAECYPTMIRQQGLSAGSMFARVGGILAPYVGYLSKFGTWIPPVIFGLCSLIAGGLTFLLPETKGMPLPETLEEGENLGLKNYAVEILSRDTLEWTIDKKAELSEQCHTKL